MIDPIALRSLALGALTAETDRDRRIITREILAMAEAEADRQLAARHGATWAAGDIARELERVRKCHNPT